MCLSNVYEKSPDADNLLLRNIADIRFEGDALVLTDIMGITRRLEAKVKKIDLLENYIIVETEKQPAYWICRIRNPNIHPPVCMTEFPDFPNTLLLPLPIPS